MKITFRMNKYMLLSTIMMILIVSLFWIRHHELDGVVSSHNSESKISQPSVSQENVIYNYCKSFSQRTRLLGPLQRNHTNGALFFPDLNTSVQDVRLLLRYSPRPADDDGIYLQLATSYLISQNLRHLSKEQQKRTTIDLFLSEAYDDGMYSKLEVWFRSIYSPYVQNFNIIRTVRGNQASWEFVIKYTKNNRQIHNDTILFLLEDDYIFEVDMLSDTIEFFASHDPCFVHQSDYPDRYTMTLNDDDGQLTIVAGKTRLWRSITSTTVTYACRLKTLLVFEHTIMQPRDDFRASLQIRKLAGNAVFFSAIPSHGAHSETLLLPSSKNGMEKIATASFYKDWWLYARRALYEAQQEETFPTRRMEKRDLNI